MRSLLRTSSVGFGVMARPCETCIFRGDGRLDLGKLLDDITDSKGWLTGYRTCHHRTVDGGEACCRGFWNSHKDDFQLGQVAQRLGLVVEHEPAKEMG